MIVNAGGAKRLCERLKKQYPELEMVVVEDALYATGAAHPANQRLWLELYFDDQTGLA